MRQYFKPDDYDTPWADIGCFVVFVTGIGSVLVGFLTLVYRPLGILAVAGLTAELSLLMVWGGVGSTPLIVRLFAIVLASAFVSLPFGSSSRVDAMVMLVAPLAALPSAALRLEGWRLAQIRTAADEERCRAANHQVQFTLGQMFLWTAMAAGAAYITQAAALPRLIQAQPQRFAAILAIAAYMGIVARSTIRCMLGPPPFGNKLLFIATFAAVGAAVGEFVLQMMQSPFTLVGLWGALNVLVMAAMLAWFRRLGFRLLNVRREPIAKE